jgi:hypothetical protein
VGLELFRNLPFDEGRETTAAEGSAATIFFFETEIAKIVEDTVRGRVHK